MPADGTTVHTLDTFHERLMFPVGCMHQHHSYTCMMSKAKADLGMRPHTPTHKALVRFLLIIHTV